MDLVLFVFFMQWPPVVGNIVYIQTGLCDHHEEPQKTSSKHQPTASLGEVASGPQIWRGLNDIQFICRKLWKGPLTHWNLNLSLSESKWSIEWLKDYVKFNLKCICIRASCHCLWWDRSMVLLVDMENSSLEITEGRIRVSSPKKSLILRRWW